MPVSHVRLGVHPQGFHTDEDLPAAALAQASSEVHPHPHLNLHPRQVKWSL